MADRHSTTPAPADNLLPVPLAYSLAWGALLLIGLALGAGVGELVVLIGLHS